MYSFVKLFFFIITVATDIVYDKEENMVEKLLLCQHMSIALECEKYADITFIVGPEKVQFLAHKIIIYCRSDYFASILQSNMKESIESKIVLLDIDPITFKHILYFIYTGNINVSDLNILLNIYTKSDEWLFTNLKQKCIRLLKKNFNAISVSQLLSKSSIPREIAELCINWLQNNTYYIYMIEWNNVLEENAILFTKTISFKFVEKKKLLQILKNIRLNDVYKLRCILRWIDINRMIDCDNDSESDSGSEKNVKNNESSSDSNSDLSESEEEKLFITIKKAKKLNKACIKEDKNRYTISQDELLSIVNISNVPEFYWKNIVYPLKFIAIKDLDDNTHTSSKVFVLELLYKTNTYSMTFYHLSIPWYIHIDIDGKEGILFFFNFYKITFILLYLYAIMLIIIIHL